MNAMNKSSQKKYEICKTLATGGTAVLYKAIQTSLDRPVVIKKLHSHLISDPNFTRRFELEAKAVASLDHENIVRIIDFGTSEGNYFIVMEYIEGQSFKDVLSSRRLLSEDLALLIAREICLGLDHAHQRGIIHRDIKPANIMLTSEGQVKITDFGLAKLHQSPTQQTVASTLLGTPLYMSPEQAIGDTIDGRSDLFSLGTICYEAMTGTQPFLSDTYAAVIQNIINGGIPAPSRIRKDISPGAAEIVMKALHREPAKRFRSALEMARAIETLLGQEKSAGARERIGRLAAGEEDVAPRPRHRSRSFPRKKGMIPLGIAAACAVAAAAFIALNPSGIGDFVDALAALRAHEPAPAPTRTLIAGQGEELPGVSLASLAEPPAAEPSAAETAQGSADSAEIAIEAPAVEFEAPRDSGLVLESSTRHLSLPNAEEMRIAELEKAKRAQQPLPPIERSAAPAELPAAEKSAEPPARSAAIEAPAMGFVDISVEPAAEIFVDGQRRLIGERLMMHELPAGEHEISCRCDGYRDYIETVRVQRGELSRRRIVLERLTGMLSLETVAGTRIYVDGAFKGMVPLSTPLDLPVGMHRIELKKSGFETWTNAVYIPRDETVRLAISLVPLAASEER